MEKKKAVAEEPQELTYTKEQILSSERYRGKRDIVAALLKVGERYSIQAVDTLIEEFKRKEVN